MKTSLNHVLRLQIAMSSVAFQQLALDELIGCDGTLFRDKEMMLDRVFAMSVKTKQFICVIICSFN